MAHVPEVADLLTSLVFIFFNDHRGNSLLVYSFVFPMEKSKSKYRELLR